MIARIHVHQVNVLTSNCASVLSSRISLGSLFQALAAENLNKVRPHLVSTSGRSNNVRSLFVLYIKETNYYRKSLLSENPST